MSSSITFLSELKGTDFQQWAAHQQSYPMNLKQGRYTKAASSAPQSKVNIDDPILNYFACLKDQGIETPSKIKAIKTFQKEQKSVSPPSPFIYPIFNCTLDISYCLRHRPKAKEQQIVNRETDRVEDEFAKLAGIINAYWQVHSSPLMEAATNDIQTELDSHIAICNTLSSPCSCVSQCECKNSEY